MKPFPTDEPFLRGYYAPLVTESDAPDLPVVGELPAGLAGTLYRNGPNPQFAPRGRYHWFSGDGMLHAFRIAGGRVSYRNRWVRTPKWEMERARGEGLSGGLTNRHLTDPALAELNSTIANTNVVWHGHRLLALEEAHAPFEVDPDTLAPRGYYTYDERLKGPMTAHPKLDPVTGEMVFFGYNARGPLTPDLMVHVADRDGRLTRSQHLVAPYPAMVHDFVVTGRHVVLPIFPLTGSMARASSGRPAYAWEPDLGSHIGILPRDGSGPMRWFRGDPSYVFHPMNAFDTADGKVVCDMMKYPVAPLFPLPDGRMPTDSPPVATLVRWTFDLSDPAAAGWTEQALSDLPGEFPRLDERFATLPYRHGWFNAAPVTDADRGRDARAGLAHIDLSNGRVAHWQPPLGDYCGEPIFVERSAGAPEGDGWLLTVIYRGAENRSDLAVFEATDLAAGPIALAQLSHRVPAGFHGNWRPAGA